MKGGTYGSSRDKGRGQRTSEGSSSGMGGGQIMAENSRTPPGKVERGRDRGARGPYARRPTLLHTQPQEDMDDISRYALVTARRETLLIKTAQLCQERWASTRTIPGYGTPPPAAAQERQPEDVTGALERSFPPESLSFSARQAPPPSKTKARSTTAHQLQMEDQPSPPEEDHQLHTDYSRLPTHAGSSSDAGLDTEEVMSDESEFTECNPRPAHPRSIC